MWSARNPLILLVGVSFGMFLAFLTSV